MLAFSVTTTYALKALACLVEGCCSTRQIADVARCARVPRPYLAKVMTLLVRAGLVDTKRGVQGGIRLTRPASEVLLLEVVIAIEGDRWMGECLLGLADHDQPGVCPTLPLWRRIRRDLESELGRLTLADLVRNGEDCLSESCNSPESSDSTTQCTNSRVSVTTKRPIKVIA